MTTLTGFIARLITTLLATGMAVFLDWLMLRVAFRLMQPASRTPCPRPVAKPRVTARAERGDLVRGTALVLRAYSAQR
jgi:hypothetical protein